MTEDVMLTTIDNPFNPFTNYDEWLAYDIEMGYNTNGLIDRVANVSDELSDEDYDSIVYEAMKEICKYNVLGIFKLIRKNDKIDLEKLKTTGSQSVQYSQQQYQQEEDYTAANYPM